MYSEDDFLQLSAIQHFVFCPRQCAMIHIEQIWMDNLFTIEGKIMHENVHEEKYEMKDGIRIERAVPLRSCLLGLNGIADVVEFHKNSQNKNLIPFPIEYKRGKPKSIVCDKVQLCAQAICLEEMLNITVPAGAIFYRKTRRRLDVDFNIALRKETEDAAKYLHEFIKSGKTPKAEYSEKCESCSILSFCMPKILNDKKKVSDYIKNAVVNL